MALNPQGFNQISSPAAAVGLGQGLTIASGLLVAAGGAGYKVGDVLTVSGGTYQKAATVLVSQVGSSGQVLAAKLQQPGLYTATPGNPASTSGGSGTGATFTLTWAANSVPSGANFATLQAMTQALSWRDDGIAPTASVGNLLPAGQTVTLGPAQLGKVQVIQATAGAVANVSFYKT